MAEKDTKVFTLVWYEATSEGQMVGNITVFEALQIISGIIARSVKVDEKKETKA